MSCVSMETELLVDFSKIYFSSAYMTQNSSKLRPFFLYCCQRSHDPGVGVNEVGVSCSTSNCCKLGPSMCSDLRANSA